MALLIVGIAAACEKKVPAPRTAEHGATMKRSDNVLSSADLGSALDRIRSERGLVRMARKDELDRLAATYATQLAEGHEDVRGLAEQVHRVIGPHAVAAVDTLDLQDASELSQLQGIGLDHWEFYGVGAAPRDAKGALAAVVYAKRNAWNGTREERKKLRDGIASFHEAFKRLYGKDAEWTARWKTGQDAAFEPLFAAATSASGLTADAFDQTVSQDPLLQWQLRKFLIDWALDADFAEQRAKGVQIRESAGARGRPLPIDL